MPRRCRSAVRPAPERQDGSPAVRCAAPVSFPAARCAAPAHCPLGPPFVGDVLAVILPILARVLAVIVIVVPRVVVHVAAAVPAVGTVVVVVVDGRANRNAGGETDQARDRRIRAAVLDDHRRRLDVDRLRVVLRHVHDLRVRRLDDDHLLTGRRRLGLHFLLRRGLEGSRIVGLFSQPLDAREHRRPIRGECLTEAGRRGQLSGHLFHDLREEGQRHEARLKVVLQGGILQVGAFQGRVARQELVERGHAGGIRRAQQHLRQKLIGIEGDWSEQAVEVRGSHGLTGRGGGGVPSGSGQQDRSVPGRQTAACQHQRHADEDGGLSHGFISRSPHS